ncbi:sulfite exporter TauE/SafE family protein [Marinobacter sp. M1N3S26]|uniref:sulfite exporter TauE/SafE family protein n=1 Tax=unclassified Marinobacter TaxID=83889 RepID=UPI00387AA842
MTFSLSLWEILALVAIGGVAGFINVLSAGGSMLTLPLLIFLGLPAQVANGTNRVAITLQSITAVGSFFRAGHSNLAVSIRLAIPAVAGSLLGAWTATWIPQAIFESILIAAMIGASAFMLLPQPKLDTRPLTPDRLGPMEYLALFLIGLYGGFIQVGVGALFIVVLYRMLKIDLPQVNVIKVFIILIYTLPALAIFAAKGQVLWMTGLVLAAGNMAGAMMAVRVNMGPQGARWIKWLTLAMVAAILVRLILY